MKFIRLPLFSKIYGKKIISRIRNNQNSVFLTFDDCKDESCTLKVLEILDKYEIKATFFCTGKNIEKNSLDLKIKERGHSIGNHGFTHLNGFKSRLQDYLDDVYKCKQIIQSNLFRPPYGKIKPSQLRMLRKDFKIILWDILTYDFDDKTTAEDVYKTVQKKVRSGSIIVMHTNFNTKNKIETALPKVIESLIERGFNFEKIKLI